METYADHPARRRAMAEPIVANLPDQIQSWCYKIDAEREDAYPIDQSDGGEDDTPEEHARWEAELVKQGRDPKRPWRQQIDRIEIDPERDFVSDRGDEIWSVLANRSIDQVMLVGVHTNMCVLGRPFGLRQLAKNGKNVVLVRDLTDTMYNPAARPYVSHFTGTDLIVSYIERYVCPTISSDQVLGGSPLRFKDDTRPTVVMMIGESEYETEKTLPVFATEHLGNDYRVRYVLEHPEPENGFVGLDQLENADALLISVRRKLLPTQQLAKVRQYVGSGKPVIGIRTASHAFCLRNAGPPPGRSDWKRFDPDVFGGHYTNHHGNQLASMVHASADAQTHPILKGLEGLPFQQGGSLYKTSPLVDGTDVLLVGKADGVPEEPVAWTFKRSDGGTSFYTSLGHKDDFEQPVFEQLLKRAIDWSLRVSESQ
jgi:type 1 glutamine amidotransferase